ncbi:DUF4876 domain-containing protein [Pedobacter steynii]|uniref:DUF4876 domain-containing protein n=1 Tax=Pedobacter steynii TaxID=430522 RepID=A0A1D7QK95_9SPHI|nr:DUF4876 domain-containing protein [Pedobacter steynii]AOM79095.1 hypothetical protein BFS30_19120 [Pedobacter steynii]
MKKLLFTLCLSSILLACKKDKTPDIKPVDLGVSLAYDISSGYTLPLTNAKVKITNILTKASQELPVGTDGKVLFTAIAVGSYDIDAVVSIPAAEYSRITGIPTEDAVTFNASEKGKQINSDFSGNLELKLIAGKSGDWVIKQIYYAGSNTSEGAGFRDQFIEFYNNTNVVLYADSLYFGQVFGRVSTANTTIHTLAGGQLDWSKSVNMPSNINANRDYIYVKTLLMIPGTGKQYPVQPGESIVLAQTALNHKSPFTGNNGKVFSVKKPELTVDLSKADFEAYYGNLPGETPFASDIDNPQVPNMEVLSYTGNDLILDNKGRDSYVIFKVDGTQKVRNWPQYNEPTKATPAPTAKKYYQIPLQYVIDGVEIQSNIASDRFPKKLPANIDAGLVFSPNGAYSSQSVIRKTQKTTNGKRVLKDTNNSSEDFDFFDRAEPKGFK